MCIVLQWIKPGYSGIVPKDRQKTRLLQRMSQKRIGTMKLKRNRCDGCGGGDTRGLWRRGFGARKQPNCQICSIVPKSM